MIQFNYKGFTMAYDIRQLEENLFAAEGEVFRLNGGASRIKRFYTEQETRIDAQKDILQRVEKYINFQIDQTK